MLLNLPRKHKTEDDDYAPIDYTFVGSVAEGERARQSKPVHQQPEHATVRHRAEVGGADEPDAEKQAEGMGARGYDAARRIPRAGDGTSRAASIAYPKPRDNSFTHTPSYAPQAAPLLENATPGGWNHRGREAGPVPGSRNPAVTERYGAEEKPVSPAADGRRNTDGGDLSARRGMPPQEATEPIPAQGTVSEPELMTAPDGSRYEAPAHQEIPEWLRLAQQNNMPYYREPHGKPRVEPAPRQAPQPQPTDLLGRPITRRAPENPEARPQGYQRPSCADDYEAAGYPPELIAQLRREEQNALDHGAGRKRHGAQYAVPPSAQDRAGRTAPRVGGTERDYAPPGYADNPNAERIPRSASRRAIDASDTEYTTRPGGTQAPSNADFAPSGSRRGGSVSQQGGYGRGNGYAPEGDWQRGGEDYAYDDPHAEGSAYAYDAQEQASWRGGMEPNNPYGRYPDERDDGFAPRPTMSARGYDASPESPYRVITESKGTRSRPAGEEPPEEQEEAPASRVPWLGIATTAAALILIFLWILQSTFLNERSALVTANVAQAERVLEQHPYSYRDLIETEARANNLHPAFVAAIVLNESSFNPNAESDVGARGLMQMMPDTAEWVSGKLDDTADYHFDMMYDPTKNVHYACWYLAYLSDLFHDDPVLVSAAFHAGQTTVQNWLSDSRYSMDSQSIQLENMAEGPTKNYATRVVKAYSIYRRLYYEGGSDEIAAANDTQNADTAPVI